MPVTRLTLLRALSAILALLVAAVHIAIGGTDSLAVMLAAGIDPTAEGALHASWHIVSAFLIWSAVMFWTGGTTARHFAGLWIAAAVIFIAVDLWQLGPSGLWVNPQWALLGPIGILAWISSQGRNTTDHD